ncbi:hypothetical protein AKO1_002902 [Acrasis kona]|uniref:Malate dehydrogenase n=1 Tax=Acrasis kona TaxID=1008807 RepID=A0AAW2YLQ7_9EUKA
MKRFARTAVSIRAAQAQPLRTYVRLLNMDNEQLDEEITRSKTGKSVSSIQEFDSWNDNLASTSEAVVKAELSCNKTFDEMQKETIDVLSKKKESNVFPFKGTTKEVETSL